MLVRSFREAVTPKSANGVWRERIVAAAALKGVRRAFAQTSRDHQWLNRQHLALCRVPAPTFQEGKRAEYLRQRFADLGHQPRIDAAGNVIVPLVYSKKLPFVAVTAHMDTTLVPSRPEDIRVDANGTMRGPGVTDNGTGLTALLALARLMGRPLVEQPARNTLLIANVAEEGEGNLHGIRYVAEHSRYSSCIDRYLVVDGASLGHITASALGSQRFDLVIKGRGGHSWNDYGRANPVHALARAIGLMTEAELPIRPRTTLSVGVVHGGTSVNSIPSLARAKIDVRSADENEIRKTSKIVEQSARIAVLAENRRSSDRLIGFELREIGSRPAARALTRNPVADCFQAVDSYLQIPSTLDCASTDANIPLAAGVPTVAIGSGGRGGDAHAPSEWYDPQGRDLGLRRLVLGLACLQWQS
jgi:acetylornithine deacetylase/succinyl-diaminopimelate desuccinylase-like protein